MPPFFSVIIPTKDRGALLTNALQSVLKQSFTDFEVLVVDNDDGISTRQSLSRISDSRVRHIRTGNLSMADNWNRGFVESQGEYTLIIADKHVLARRALETVYRVVEAEPHDVVLWSMGTYAEQNGTGYLSLPPQRDQPHQYKTRAILEKFTRNPPSPETMVDLAYNSATRRSIIDSMLNEGLKRVCQPVAPDYALVYQHLAYCHGLFHLGVILSVQGSAETGNGFKYVAKTDPATTQSFIESSGGASVFSSHVPIKSATIECSFLFNDYLRMRERVGRNLADYDVDLGNYFRGCYLELIRRQIYLGADVREEFRAWEEALREQAAPVQRALANRLRLGMKARAYWLTFRVMRRLFLPAKVARLRRTQPPFQSIMEALEWLDQQQGESTLRNVGVR